MFSKIFKIIINTVLGLLVILGVFVTFSFVPAPGNYKLFTVMSGSMEPTIHTGSLIFVKPQSSYEVGDVVTRMTNDPKVTVTHRISSKEESDGQVFFDTKGDANSAPDGARVTPDKIVGREIFKIPFIGYPIGYAKSPQGLILLIIIPAVIIIYDEINKIKDEIRKKLDERRKRKENDKSGGEVTVEEKIK